MQMINKARSDFNRSFYMSNVRSHCIYMFHIVYNTDLHKMNHTAYGGDSPTVIELKTERKIDVSFFPASNPLKKG